MACVLVGAGLSDGGHGVRDLKQSRSKRSSSYSLMLSYTQKYPVPTPKSPSLLVLPARLVVNSLNGSTTSEPKDSRKERETFRNWAPTALTPGAIWECACERGRVLHLHKFLRAYRGDRTRSLHNHPHPASAAEKWQPATHASVHARTRAHAHTQTSAPEPYVHSSPSVHRGSTRQRSRGI